MTLAVDDVSLRREGMAAQWKTANSKLVKLDFANQKSRVLENLKNHPSLRNTCHQENPFSLAEINEFECIAKSPQNGAFLDGFEWSFMQENLFPVELGVGQWLTLRQLPIGLCSVALHICGLMCK